MSSLSGVLSRAETLISVATSVMEYGLWQSFFIFAMSRYCHPEVRPHCIFRVAPQVFYDYVLFDPFVEYLNIPPMSIQASHLCCTDFEVVRDERNFFPTVIDSDHTHRLWVEVYRFGGKAYGKVTLDTFFPVGIRQLSMANDFILHVLLWPAYPVGSCQMEAEKCIEVNISRNLN